MGKSGLAPTEQGSPTVTALWDNRNVTVPINSLMPFQTLVTQVWGVLKRTLRVTFPTTTPGHPSPYVFLQPGMLKWSGEFWQDIVVPTVGDLLVSPPPYVDGWWNPMAHTLVEAKLRSALVASTKWLPLMDFTR